jgi:hypothetical protein
MTEFGSDDDDIPPADWQPSDEEVALFRAAQPFELDRHMGGELEELSGNEWLAAQRAAARSPTDGIETREGVEAIARQAAMGVVSDVAEMAASIARSLIKERVTPAGSSRFIPLGKGQFLKLPLHDVSNANIAPLTKFVLPLPRPLHVGDLRFGIEAASSQTISDEASPVSVGGSVLIGQSRRL